jgi:hypothetical protein
MPFRTVAAVRGRTTTLVAVLLCWLPLACADEPASEAPSATVAAGRTSTSTTATTVVASTTVPEPTPATGVEGEVEAAYLRSWDVYADAVLRLDDSRLAEVYAGEALVIRKDEIADLATDGSPVRVAIEHDYEVVLLNATSAVVLENYRNHSVLLDGSTMQPLEPDPNDIVRREYVLVEEGSGWRVSQLNAAS